MLRFPDIWGLTRRLKPVQLSLICVAIAFVLAVAVSHLLWFWVTGAVPDGLTIVAGAAALLVSIPMVQVFVTAVYRLEDSNQRLLITKTKLNFKNEELALAHDALSELNQELEFRVTERTAKLVDALRDAESANKTKSVFLANMSHELRTPLNGIIGYADMIINRHTLFGDEALAKIDEHAVAIYVSGQHLNAMVGDLLDLSKIEFEQYDFNVELLCARSLVTEVVTKFSPVARMRGQSVDVVFLSEETSIQTDRRALHQVLGNLLSNALKYSEEGQRVCINVERCATDITFTIEDRGIGMSAEALANATRPFSKFSDAHIASGQSVGLGLSIGSKLCTLLGGSLTLTSEENAGTTARASFPVSSTDHGEETPVALAS